MTAAVEIDHRLSEPQVEAFERAVRGRSVVDLGAGPLAPLTILAASVGASSVLAVDKESFEVEPPAAHVRLLSADLAELVSGPHMVDAIEVAVLSWPWLSLNVGPLLKLIERCHTIVYVGKNTDGIRCGSPRPRTHRHLWDRLTDHRVVDHVPADVQVLTVYDIRTYAPYRELLQEERAALSDSIVHSKGRTDA